jgi:hypothetical protein
LIVPNHAEPWQVVLVVGLLLGALGLIMAVAGIVVRDLVRRAEHLVEHRFGWWDAGALVAAAVTGVIVWMWTRWWWATAVGTSIAVLAWRSIEASVGHGFDRDLRRQWMWAGGRRVTFLVVVLMMTYIFTQ